MSRENVEIVRRSTDAYSRGDLDRMLEHWAPTPCWTPSNLVAGDTNSRGDAFVRGPLP